MKARIAPCLVASILWSLGMTVDAQDRNPEKFSKPEIVGHRGASFSAPENTLASVRKAIEFGADAAEVDVHLSVDEQVVVIHDPTTKRTTGLDHLVAETAYKDLMVLDAGSFKGVEFKGEKIPLLQEVLDIIPFGFNLYIEIKGPTQMTPKVADLVRNCSYPNQIRIIAFDLETITLAKELLPKVPCYYLKSVVLPSSYETLAKELKKRNLDGADLHYATISRKLIRKFRENGMDCLVWTVNSDKTARKLKRMGVVGITTDRPELLVGAF